MIKVHTFVCFRACQQKQLEPSESRKKGGERVSVSTRELLSVSAVSGELVCRALGDSEHEKPLFTVWLQHTNIREASLV